MADPNSKPRVLTDIEIAQAAQLRPIIELARERLAIDEEFLEPYGRFKAKVALRFIETLRELKLDIQTFPGANSGVYIATEYQPIRQQINAAMASLFALLKK